MSRVGKKPIVIPEGVEVVINGNNIHVKGPNGELSRDVNSVVEIAVIDADGSKTVSVSVKDETDKNARSQWGTARSVISGMVQGVTERFSKKLEVNGVGYKVNMAGRNIVLNVGYSHEVPFQIPELVEASVDGNVITLASIDKQLLGEVAANIRKIRKPEPYKGKGIKYDDEVIRRKAGKSQKAGE